MGYEDYNIGEDEEVPDSEKKSDDDAESEKEKAEHPEPLGSLALRGENFGIPAGINLAGLPATAAPANVPVAPQAVNRMPASLASLPGTSPAATTAAPQAAATNLAARPPMTAVQRYQADADAGKPPVKPLSFPKKLLYGLGLATMPQLAVQLRYGPQLQYMNRLKQEEAAAQGELGLAHTTAQTAAEGATKTKAEADTALANERENLLEHPAAPIPKTMEEELAAEYRAQHPDAKAEDTQAFIQNAKTPPLGDAADQINDLRERQYQIYNPGKPLPDSMKAKPTDTQKEVDRVDGMMRAMDTGQATQAQRAEENAIRQQTAVIAQTVFKQNQQDRDAAPQFLTNITNTTGKGNKYINREDIKGAGKNAEYLTILAAKSGIPIVDKDVAVQLENIDEAKKNQDYMLATIGAKLAKDPTGRFYSAPANTIEKLAQTDPELAAVGTFRSPAIQTVRAVAGGQGLRMNEAVINMAIENDIPKITDTLPVAQQKVKNLREFMDNAEDALLTRDRSKSGGAQGNAGGGKAAPSHAVGDTVQYKGKPAKVTAVSKDGKLTLDTSGK